jgi:hypothetical protein
MVYDRPEVIALQPDGLRPAIGHRPQGYPFACPTMGAIGLSPRAMITLTFGVIF